MLAFQSVDNFHLEGPSSSHPYFKFHADSNPEMNLLRHPNIQEHYLTPHPLEPTSFKEHEDIDSTGDSLRLTIRNGHSCARNDCSQASKIFPLNTSLVQRCLPGCSAANQRSSTANLARKNQERTTFGPPSWHYSDHCKHLSSNEEKVLQSLPNQIFHPCIDSEETKLFDKDYPFNLAKPKASELNTNEIINKRFSTRKLIMSCISPETNWSNHILDLDTNSKSQKEAKHKKRKKSNGISTFNVNKESELCKPLELVIVNLDDKSQTLRQDEEIDSINATTPSKNETASNSQLLPSRGDGSNNELRKSQTNLNYNSANLNLDSSSEKQGVDVTQSNNNSIPSGSILSMAREMLKKNAFHSTPSKSKDMYTVVDMNIINYEDDDLDEMNIRRKNSERWLKLAHPAVEQFQGVEPTCKPSKISRSSLNTLHSQANNRPDSNEHNSQLVTIPDNGVISTSKKSRMYMSSNVHLRRLYQPAGVVNYLMQRYKHRQPKISDGSQGYDQTVRNVVKNLHDSWLEQNQCDVAIVTDEGEIMTHQAVLSSFSSSLASLFRANKPVSDNDSCSDIPHPILMINMSEFPRDIIADTLHFLYTTDIKLDISNVSQFVLVARRLELPVLSKICDDYLLNNGNLDTLLLHYLIANNCELSSIATTLESKIAENFEVVWTKKHIVKLSRSLLLGILNHSDLSISEINKFHAVAKWLEYSKAERIKYVNDLMKFVDFEKIEINSLLSTVKNLDWMFTNEAMRTKMLNAYKSSVGVGKNIISSSEEQEQDDSPLKVNTEKNDAKGKRTEKGKHSDMKPSTANSARPHKSPSSTASLRNDTLLQSKCNSPFNEDFVKDYEAERGSLKNSEEMSTNSVFKQPNPDSEKHQTPREIKTRHASCEKALAVMTSSPAKIYEQQRRPKESQDDCHLTSRHGKHRSQATSPLCYSRQSIKLPHKQSGHVNMGTTMTPVFDFPRETERRMTSVDYDDAYNNSLRPQGVVSLFLPNYKPPPFKQYQLTSNTNSVKYVEL